ncbi:replication restart helicase PriA [Coraliomargarita parva]|uniref:replication restart helicase PriA n=1 Tax=Coraliomargarita parva TaxID=3014050 RepID=UPI0022B4F8B5|nr:primosomal protein N' [Coraliomargarita parva]
MPKAKAQRDTAVVEVVPLSGFDADLAYAVPPICVEQMRPGLLVRIPLRRRSELGVVTRLGTDQVVPPGKLKMLYEIVQPHPVLPADMLQLFRWAMRYYSATPESMLEAMIPSAIRKGMRPKTRRYLAIGEAPDAEAWQELERRAPKQAELLRFIQQQFKPLPRATVLNRLKISASACEALVAKGYLQESDTEEARVAYDDDISDSPEVVGHALRPTLTPEQAQAVEAINGAIDLDTFSVRLLHGVTGSGKTEVYLNAIEKVVATGGGVIFLVPEVALAPQTVGRVRSRLEARGVHTTVWHSHLSDGERYDAWNALASGEAHVVVGARSAVFAPVQNLKLIIVDEEHEPSYKQEEAPRYHGRDVAVYRAMINQAVCVLGSATPSLESLYNVERGKYAVDRILKRVDDRQLPRLHLVDMRREALQGKGPSPISRLLMDKMVDRFEKKEQSILFLNRRGYSTSMLCPECGYVAECEHCSIPMTFHRTDKTLRCHLCGEMHPAPHRCPKCKAPDIRWRGQGTQKIEDIVQKILPRARIVRMDADSMSKKNLYRKILNDFRIGKIDLLVGTQMIAKGLDFPNVTLVGLVDADMSLHVEDFRAAERTFQLIVQVSGRAGRGDRAGEVVIQTSTPHAPPIQFARQSDFDGFQLEELEQRREFNYPPFRHLIRHLFRGRNPEKIEFYMEQWLKVLEKELGDQIEIRGPAPAPIEKIRDEYRFQLWYFAPSASRVIESIAKLRKSFPLDKEVIDLLDVDPMQMS